MRPEGLVGAGWVRADRAAGGSPAAVYLLAFFTFATIGRLAEAFTVLVPFRIQMLTGVAMLLAATALPPDRSGRLRGPEARLFVLLFGYATITIPLSTWPGQSLDFVIDFLKAGIFFFLLLYCVRSERDLGLIVWATVAAAGLLQFAMLRSASSTGRTHVTGLYDPNDLALQLVCILPLAFSLALSGRGLARLAAATVALLCAVGVGMSGSRGGFLTLVVVAGLLFLRMPGRLRWLVGGLVPVVFLLMAASPAWDRIAALWGGNAAELSEYEAGGFAMARSHAWRRGLELMLGAFPLGVGAGTYETAEGLTRDGGGKWETSHNSLLQIGAELGVLGIVVYVGLLYFGIRNCRVARRLAESVPDRANLVALARGLEVAIWAYIIGGFSLSQAYASIQYLLLGLAFALRALMIDAVAEGEAR